MLRAARQTDFAVVEEPHAHRASPPGLRVVYPFRTKRTSRWAIDCKANGALLRAWWNRRGSAPLPLPLLPLLPLTLPLLPLLPPLLVRKRG